MTDQFPNLPADLETRLHNAFRFWHGSDTDEGTLDGLLIYQQSVCTGAVTPRQATNAVLKQALLQLDERWPCGGEILRLRFCNSYTVDEVKAMLSFADSTVFAKQCQALHYLAEIVADMERSAWEDRFVAVSTRVDVPDPTIMIGTDDQVRRLTTLLTLPAPPWIVSIEGIGGIGKTTQARAVVRDLLKTSTFDDYAWVSAQPAILDLGGSVRPRAQPALSETTLVNMLVQQLMPELAGGLGAVPGQALAVLSNRLKRSPHLIVIDNLETISDLEALMPTLHMLANPSKFILTSRRRLFDEPCIHLHLVPELSEVDSLSLVRTVADRHGLGALVVSSDAELRPIYETVGGNPLALQLVVGQTHVRSLDTVLHDLQTARSMPVESLYAFIYQQAWEGLDENSRRVLLAMPMVNVRGDSEEFITALCDLASDAVRSALHRLITLNLIQTTGDLHHNRYYVHSLTRTFLQEQVARWQ